MRGNLQPNIQLDWLSFVGLHLDQRLSALKQRSGQFDEALSVVGVGNPVPLRRTVRAHHRVVNVLLGDGNRESTSADPALILDSENILKVYERSSLAGHFFTFLGCFATSLMCFTTFGWNKCFISSSLVMSFGCFSFFMVNR